MTQTEKLGEVKKLASGLGGAVANAINKANEMRDKRIIKQAKREERERIIKVMDEYCLREIDHAKTMKTILEKRNAKDAYIHSEATTIATLGRVIQVLKGQGIG